jgi:hypothetical protein
MTNGWMYPEANHPHMPISKKASITTPGTSSLLARNSLRLSNFFAFIWIPPSTGVSGERYWWIDFIWI